MCRSCLSSVRFANKHAFNSTMCHFPAKHGGVNMVVVDDRCHIAMWTAWLTRLPSVMGSMGLDDMDELIDKCPNIVEQLSTVQTSVAQSIGLAILGAATIGDIIEYNSWTQEAGHAFASCSVSDYNGVSWPAAQGFTQICGWTYGGIVSGSTKVFFIHHPQWPVCYSNLSQSWLCLGGA